MVKLVSKKTTTTVTEEVELVPTESGEVKNHRFMRSGDMGPIVGMMALSWRSRRST